MTLQLFVLDATGAPVVVDTPAAYGEGLLDPRRVVGFDNLPIGSGSIWIQTEFVGVDDDGSRQLWQTQVEWASMLGHSRSFVRYTSLADAIAGHGTLRAAMQHAADLLNLQGGV